MLDLMVLAFWTDTTRIVSFMLGNDNSRMIFDFLGINEEHHYLSHFIRNPGAETIPHFNRITQWHVQQFAYLITRMSAIDDGAGTLLDNSILMYGSGMKHSDFHSRADLPLVLAGGGCGTLKTGRWLRYPRPVIYANLLLSLLQRMGVDEKQFGTSTGPLEGLDREMNYDLGNRDDGSWVVETHAGSLTARGLMLRSEDIDDVSVYFIKLSDGRDVKVKVPFGPGNRFQLDNWVGSVVDVAGTFELRDGKIVVTALTRVGRRGQD